MEKGKYLCNSDYKSGNDSHSEMFKPQNEGFMHLFKSPTKCAEQCQPACFSADLYPYTLFKSQIVANTTTTTT